MLKKFKPQLLYYPSYYHYYHIMGIWIQLDNTASIYLKMHDITNMFIWKQNNALSKLSWWYHAVINKQYGCIMFHFSDCRPGVMLKGLGCYLFLFIWGSYPNAIELCRNRNSSIVAIETAVEEQAVIGRGDSKTWHQRQLYLSRPLSYLSLGIDFPGGR